MIKVSDYLARRLWELGLRHVFMVTGGGAMHLNDSFARGVPFEVLYHHHEQACAIAAEGLYRASGQVGVVNITTGPGGLNTLTGVMGQWTDSIPAIYVSGQVKQSTTLDACRHLPLRQLGDQEVDILSVVSPLVKYAVCLKDPARVRYEVEKAFHLALEGRMGPVWIDVPMDIQGALVDEDALEGYVPPVPDLPEPDLTEVVARLLAAERPLLVPGHGVRLAGQQGTLETLLDLLQIPAVATFNGFDLLPGDHPSFCGRIGTLGSRGGNFALHNADLVLFLGTRNNVRQVSYAWEHFADRAFTVALDVDGAELDKPTFKPQLKVQADLKEALPKLLASLQAAPIPDWSAWRDRARATQEALPVVDGLKADPAERLEPYAFFEAFTRALPAEATVVAGNGTACVALFQAGVVKRGQRMFWNSGCASMGFDLPAALGAAVGTRRPVWCLAGDGSLQMNLQELATLAFHGLPVRLVYLENGGYASIRQTQANFFQSQYGCGAGSGVGFPDMEKLAAAYGLPYVRTTSRATLAVDQARVAEIEGPVVWEVRLSLDYAFEPKVSSEKLPDGRIVSKPLQDMYPFLPRDEYSKHVI